MASKSKKTEIIERLFNKRWDSETLTLHSPVVTLTEVSEAIREYNQENSDSPLSERNPANFFKDFIRKTSSANLNFPETVFNLGYTARQVTGDSYCFEFVRCQEGQSQPFPSANIPHPDENTPVHRIGTVVISSIARQFGVRHETWLVQVIVELRILETHFSLFSPRQIHEIGYLQSGVKQRRTEIDALYHAIEYLQDSTEREVIICCEVKGRSDNILEDQLIAQVQTVFMRGSQPAVIPVAVKIIGDSKIYLVEFTAVERGSELSEDVLTAETTVIYELVPPVNGIC